MSDVNEQILAELKTLNKKMDQLILRSGTPAGPDLDMYPVNHVGPGAMPGMTGDPGAMAAMASAGRPDSIRDEIQRRIAEAKKNSEVERARADALRSQEISFPVIND